MATIQNRNGSYSIRVSCGYSSDGKQIIKSTTFNPPEGMTSRQIDKELDRQAAIFEERVKRGEVLNSNIKFADFAEKWVKDYGEKQLAPKTLNRYKEILVRINASIGHLRLDRLQPHHIIELYENLTEEGIKDDTSYTASADITKILKERNIKQLDFSKAAGLSTSTVRVACKGETVAISTAEKISKVLDMKQDDLFTAHKGSGKLAANTIVCYHRVLSSVLSTAVNWQVIFSNPCERVKPPKCERHEAQYLDEKQAAKLIELLESEPIQYRTEILLLIYSGLRRGELFGLKWSDIDFDGCIINISRSLQYLPGEGLSDKDTKTKSSVRVLKLPTVAFDMLREFRQWQAGERLKVGDQWIDGNYLFTQWNGKPMFPDTLTSWFEDFIKRTDLPYIHVHSLRHTNATLMIAGGTDVRTVSKRLGHAQTSTTMNIYSHAIKSADEAAAETLQNILNPIGKGRKA
jgi:integrase